MAETRLTLRLFGDRDYIPIEPFLEAVGDTLSLLNDLDAAISARPRGTLRWLIADLGRGSATLTLMPETIVEDIDVGTEVVNRFVDGLDQINREATPPPYFTDEVLEKARGLASVLGAGVKRIEVQGPVRKTVITQRLAANVDEIIGKEYEYSGSVEGTLEMISVHGEGSFNVYHAISGRRVQCNLPKHLLETAKEALGRRVLVHGRLRVNAKGHPRRVLVEGIRVLGREEELPKAKDIRGILPDLTEGLETTEYLRRLRGD